MDAIRLPQPFRAPKLLPLTKRHFPLRPPIREGPVVNIDRGRLIRAAPAVKPVGDHVNLLARTRLRNFRQRRRAVLVLVGAHVPHLVALHRDDDAPDARLIHGAPVAQHGPRGGDVAGVVLDGSVPGAAVAGAGKGASVVIVHGREVDAGVHIHVVAGDEVGLDAVGVASAELVDTVGEPLGNSDG